MDFITYFGRLIALDRRHLYQDRTHIVGFIRLEEQKHRVIFSDQSWPVGHLRYFLGLELIVIVAGTDQRVVPAPIGLQPEHIRNAAPLQGPPDVQWLASLPTITDRVDQRPKGPLLKTRFISSYFCDQVKRSAQLEEAARGMGVLLEDAGCEEAKFLRDLNGGYAPWWDAG